MSTADPLLQNCPFPPVALALRPYIKTRQEVDAIRSRLQQALPVSSVTAAAPACHRPVPSISLPGARKAYVRAVQAHHAAQARYDSLRAEVDQLSVDCPPSHGHVGGSASFVSGDYMPVMRQREKQRKLKVVQAALSRLDAVGGRAIADSLDRVARRRLGELPVPPPSAAWAERDAGHGSEYDMTRLKKAVLAVRLRLDEHKAAPDPANAPLDQAPNPHAHLHALKKAHHVLTAWMEQQLALIGHLEALQDGSDATHAPAEPHAEAEYSVQEIAGLYGEYLASRERLLGLVSNVSSRAASTPASPEVIRRASNPTEPEHTQSASEALLPYLSRLVAMRQAARDLLQQSAYIRRQLNRAETRTHEVLDRLANESRIVQPDLHRDISYGAAWKNASDQASKSTAESAALRLKSGQASADGAAKCLEAIQSMPASWHA